MHCSFGATCLCTGSPCDRRAVWRIDKVCAIQGKAATWQKRVACTGGMQSGASAPPLAREPVSEPSQGCRAFPGHKCGTTTMLTTTSSVASSLTVLRTLQTPERIATDGQAMLVSCEPAASSSHAHCAPRPHLPARDRITPSHIELNAAGTCSSSCACRTESRSRVVI